ncbi:MAG: molybdenum cofactor biosynthesis protein MoaE [Phycisphaerales bacterium]|jgi:molybdopterin synthase catalytic subunit|nr:molybdenum cofactor biosynthesis protein MoaE [Phycisphaerales bacterium]
MCSPPHIETSLVSGPVEPCGFDHTPACGAEVVFLGRTRAEQHERHGELHHLDYETHPEMVAPLMQELATQAAARWPLHAIRLQHATGKVAPGQASVAIEVLAGHRAEAFEACRWLIDTLKVRLPIWKREVWADGTTWVDGTPVRPEA